MNDFDYDVIQKKRIAQGARHRVIGSKTKHVNLPQYTKAEIKKRSGQVMTYTMNEKHTMKELRGWADDMRKKYLQRLANECGMTAVEMTRILDVSVSAVYQALRREGIKPQGGQRSDEQREKYLAMMGLVETKEEGTQGETCPASIPDIGKISFTGNYADALKTVAVLLGNGKGTIMVEWFAEEEKDNG